MTKMLHPLILFIVSLTALSIHNVKPVRSSHCQPIRAKRGLNILNCSDTDLTQLPKLDDRAEVLDFSRNQFEELPFMLESTECHEDANCKVINEPKNHCRYAVSFHRNKIKKILNHALHNLRCLNSLDLSYNDIQSSSLEPWTFQEGAHNLQTLILAGNPLGNLPDNVITEPFLPKLRHLDLTNCKLEEIGESSVDDHYGLRTLMLRNNRLKQLNHGTFKGLRSLSILDLEHNLIQNIGHELFGDLKSLTHLNLANNKIESFARHSFYRDSKLRILDLTMNMLKSIPYHSLQELSHLTHLKLNSNPMESFSSPNSSIILSNVTTLEMNGMMWMTKLDKGALAAFPSLNFLFMKNNKNLKAIHPHFLPQNPSKLKKVYLENSGLSTLPADALPWKQLKYLGLKGNPWHCDYRIQWMIQAKVVRPGSVKCDLPVELRGRDIKSIDPRKLQRYFPLTAIFGMVGVALALPALILLVYLVWKRKHHCCHSCSDVHGRYVTVFTRETDGEGDDHVDIEVRAHQRLLKAVSNGDADDTRPFIMLEHDQATSRPDEDEI